LLSFFEFIGFIKFIGFAELLGLIEFIEFIEFLLVFSEGFRFRGVLSFSGFLFMLEKIGYKTAVDFRYLLCLVIYFLKSLFGNISLIQCHIGFTLHFGSRAFGYKKELDEFPI